MLKKIICIVLVLVSTVAIYRVAYKKDDLTSKSAILKRGYNIKDIISINKENLDEMAEKSAYDFIEKFKKSSPYKLDIQVKPLKERKCNENILWEKKDNDIMKIIVYKKGSIFHSIQINALYYFYAISTDINLYTYEQYINGEKIKEWLKESEENRTGERFFAELADSNFIKEQSEGYDSTELYNIPYYKIWTLYNSAALRYSLLAFYCNKARALRGNPSYKMLKVKGHKSWEEEFKLYENSRKQWHLAFSDYHLRKHWLRYELLYYSNLAIFFLTLILCIFSFIQFFRKDLKKIIREELKEKGVTLTSGLIHKIFWRNWGCLIYQARDEKTKIKIAKIADSIAKEIRDNVFKKKLREIWPDIKKASLPKRPSDWLVSKRKKALDSDSGYRSRMSAVDALQEGFNNLLQEKEVEAAAKKEISEEKVPEKRVVFKKKKKEIPERNRFILQIKELTNKVEQNVIEGLSNNNLFYLMSTIRLLPKIDPFALEKFFSLKIKNTLSNKRFTEAISTEDKNILMDLLGLKEKPKPKSFTYEVDVMLLKEMKVVIIGGNKVDRKGQDIIEWTYSLGAQAARYISGSKYAEFGAPAKNADLVIIVRPIDHTAQWKIVKTGTPFIWVNHFSRKLYLKEVCRYFKRDN